MSAFLPPLLSESDQTAVVAAAYENRLCAAVAELSLHPASVQRTRAEVPAFAAALDAADDWQAMRIAESLRQLAVDTSTDAKVRVPLAKELLRQRPPSAWTQAKRAGRTKPTTKTDPQPDSVTTHPMSSTTPTSPTRPARPQVIAHQLATATGRATDPVDAVPTQPIDDPVLGPLLHPPPELSAAFADDLAAQIASQDRSPDTG